MKKHRSVRGKVGVERGLGPRHAFNAQEGSEAVPSALPEPLPEDLRVKPNSFGNLRPALLAKLLGQELGSLSKEDVAKIGISLLMGGEGPEALPPGGKPVQPGLKFHDPYPRYEGPAEPMWEPPSAEDIGKAVPYSKALEAKAKEIFPSLKDPKYEGLLEANDPNATWENVKIKEVTPVEPPPEEPLFEPNVPRYRKGARKIGVAKGFGPRNAENSKEGDLTKVNTDTVPAMLTPREAVMNRNAAELAGRGNIEKLNAEGNALARKGVDLASGGMSDVKEKIMNKKPKSSKTSGNQSSKQSGSPYVQAFQKLMPKGGAPVGYQGGGAVLGQPGGTLGQPGGMLGMPNRNFPHPNAGLMHPGAGVIGQPAEPGGLPGLQGRDFPHPNAGLMHPGLGGMQGPGAMPTRNIGSPNPYLPGNRGNPIGLASGTGSVPLPGPIGTPPQGEEAYGPPVNLTAPQIQRLAQQTGLSAGQIQGLMSAVQGIGGIGGGNANATGTGTLIDSGGMAYPTTGGYQGGISDIGYPPFVAPSANYDGNRGGWLGPYDPSFMIQHYAGGISSVPFR